MTPVRGNWLDVRTLGYSLACLCLGWWVAGPFVGIPFALIVYVAAARSPRNVSTCPFCGAGTNPQASVCRACGHDVR